MKEAEKVNRIKELTLYTGRYFRTFYRWLLVAASVGAISGLVGSAFNLTVGLVTDVRTENAWLIFLLPVGGLVIAAIYRLSKLEGEGTNNVIESIYKGEKVPTLLIPVIFVSTAITHLLGGSAGREGAALQIGGGIGSKVGRLLGLDEKDMPIVTLCGMSAVFSALFGTPLTATIFALEVISVGILHYSAFIPCLVASTVAYGISRLLGIAPTQFAVTIEPLELVMVLKVAVLAVICALVSIAFCVSVHKVEELASKKIKNCFLRAFIGGCVVVALTLLVGSHAYNGAGTDIIAAALNGECPDWAFFWKIVFTAVTIGCGFKGGEIVPTFFIGATLGCVVGPVLGMPAGFAAAIALIAVFCGAVNCPIASIILSVEMFGSSELIYFALACGISYMLSGYYGLYSSQKIMYSKTRAEFINRYAR